MDTLFDIPETLSPKLAWMRKHNVGLSYTPPQPAKYSAATDDKAGNGNTEMEALSNLASKLGVPMWDEESLTTQKSHE